MKARRLSGRSYTSLGSRPVCATFPGTEWCVDLKGVSRDRFAIIAEVVWRGLFCLLMSTLEIT